MSSHMEVGSVLLSEEQIRRRVSELALEISGDYKGREIFIVGILKGAFVFLADLSRQISVPLEFDFMALSSYGSATKTSGVVRILKDLDTDIRGRDVLLVEDIVDTGLTLRYVSDLIRAREPDSLEICALLDKQISGKVDLKVKYVGFRIPDLFVVGYGLDYAEKYRNLPYIATIKKQDARGF